MPRLDVYRLTDLQNDIRTLIADCIHLKTLLRARWTRPMAEEQRRLIRTRRRLTARFVLLAVARGRLHVIHPPRELRDAPGFDLESWDAAAYNARIAERLLPGYTVAPTMSEVVQ